MSGILSGLAAVALLASDPYVRSRALVGDPDSHCLWWKEGTAIEYRQSEQGNPATTGESEFSAVTRSFQTWQAALGAGGSLSLVEGPRTPSRKVGHDVLTTNNENLVLFRTVLCRVSPGDPCRARDDCMNQHDCWDYDSGTIALTTTTYESTSGFIYGSDIEANAASFVFTTVDSPPCVYPVFTQSCVATDVQNTITHEIGHLLGLDHTTYPGSTMQKSAPAGETSKRTLDPGTLSFIPEVYPQGRPARDCVIQRLPSSLGSVPGGCGCSQPGAPWLLALPFLLLGRRRRG